MKHDNDPGRRDFLKKAALLSAAGIAMSATGMNVVGDSERFVLPPLGYDYAALEPHIDRMTMEIHHAKHHQSYVNNLNKACQGNVPASLTLEEILAGVSAYNAAVRNNGGGHYNHSMFWTVIKPGSKMNTPSDQLQSALNASFGSHENFLNKFNQSAMSVFGSGWTWLVENDGRLEIGNTPNQDNPLMNASGLKGKPLLCLDVWEHAYYLKHQNKRAEYLKSFWNVINWEEVSRRFSNSK
jgi:Fe-Mn family superoxide dismutase